MRSPILPAFAAIVATLAIAACGSSSSSPSGSGSSSAAPSSSSPATNPAAASGSGTASTSSTSSSAGSGAAAAKSVISLSTATSGALMFSTNSLSAKAGKVTIHFTNMAPEGHDLSIQQGTNGKVLAETGVFKGGTKTLTLTLTPGKYTYYCNVPGHRQGGMQGTLTVVAA